VRDSNKTWVPENGPLNTKSCFDALLFRVSQLEHGAEQCSEDRGSVRLSPIYYSGKNIVPEIEDLVRIGP
jgi:hypothetical protein